MYIRERHIAPLRGRPPGSSGVEAPLHRACLQQSLFRSAQNQRFAALISACKKRCADKHIFMNAASTQCVLGVAIQQYYLWPALRCPPPETSVQVILLHKETLFGEVAVARQDGPSTLLDSETYCLVFIICSEACFAALININTLKTFGSWLNSYGSRVKIPKKKQTSGIVKDGVCCRRVRKFVSSAVPYGDCLIRASSLCFAKKHCFVMCLGPSSRS